MTTARRPGRSLQLRPDNGIARRRSICEARTDHKAVVAQMGCRSSIARHTDFQHQRHLPDTQTQRRPFHRQRPRVQYQRRGPGGGGGRTSRRGGGIGGRTGGGWAGASAIG